MTLANPFTVYAPGLAGVPKEERYMSPGGGPRPTARCGAATNIPTRALIRRGGAGNCIMLKSSVRIARLFVLSVGIAATTAMA
jgi:hypothetical protein